MKFINYMCDGCSKQIFSDNFHTYDVPVGINLRENRIYRKDYHFCTECAKPEYIEELGLLEHKLRLHIDKFLKDNPLIFE